MDSATSINIGYRATISQEHPYVFLVSNCPYLFSFVPVREVATRYVVRLRHAVQVHVAYPWKRLDAAFQQPSGDDLTTEDDDPGRR